MSVLDVITGLLVYDTIKKEIARWKKTKKDIKRVFNNNSCCQDDQNAVAKNGLSINTPSGVIIPKQQPGLTSIIDTNGFIPKVEKRSSHVHSNHIPMNTTFILGGENVRDQYDITDRNTLMGCIEQFSFITPRNIKSNKYAALCIKLFGDKIQDVEDSVYKKCGFSDVKDYHMSSPGKYNEESIQISKKLETVGNKIELDSNDKIENLTMRGIGHYDSNRQDSYDQFVANLVSGETQIFAAPTIEEVRKSYERNREVRSRIKYSDLWFCLDWKEDD